MTLLHDWRSALHHLRLHNSCVPDIDLIAQESGRRILMERKRRGWSQKELAKQTGHTENVPDQAQPNALSPSRIGNFEQGTRRVGIEESRILERVFGRPAPYFMGVITEREAAVIAALRHPPGSSDDNHSFGMPDPSY